MKTPLLQLFVLCLATASASAVSSSITFEGQSNTIYGDPINREGYLIGNPAGQEQHFHEITSTGFGLPNNGTGVLLNDRDTQIFVTEFDASPFSLLSVQVAAASGNSPALGLVIQGFLNSSLVGTLTLASLGNGYTTVDGSFITGAIDRLVFDGIDGGGGFVLDNLQLENSPSTAPQGVADAGSTVALLGLAMSGMAWARRKASI